MMWSKWVALCSEQEAGTTVALFRIAIGLCLMGTLSNLVILDLVDVLWMDSAYGGYRNLGERSWLITALGGPRPEVIWPLVGITITAGLLMALGVGGRITALVGLQGWLALSDVNGHAGGSYDQLMANALWILVLAGGTQAWSLPHRLRTGTWQSQATVGKWVRGLILAQLVVMYVSTGFQKVSAHWTPMEGYSALYYILQQPSWQRWDMFWVAQVYPLTQVATAVTWFFEVLSPLVILSMLARRRPGGTLRSWLSKWDLRKPFALIGVCLHLGVEVTMNVGPFSVLTLIYYLALWSPEEWARAINHIPGRALARS